MTGFVKSMLGGVVVGLMIAATLASSQDSYERWDRQKYDCYTDPDTQICYLIDNEPIEGVLP
jgi:hypothetical protein